MKSCPLTLLICGHTEVMFLLCTLQYLCCVGAFKYSPNNDKAQWYQNEDKEDDNDNTVGNIISNQLLMIQVVQY